MEISYTSETPAILSTSTRCKGPKKKIDINGVPVYKIAKNAFGACVEY
jgi:hypothetical protein